VISVVKSPDKSHSFSVVVTPRFPRLLSKMIAKISALFLSNE
jgi:hypothetical protein